MIAPAIKCKSAAIVWNLLDLIEETSERFQLGAAPGKVFMFVFLLFVRKTDDEKDGVSRRKEDRT